MQNTKSIVKVNAIKRLLELIERVNVDIESSKKMNSALLVRQYEHLKRKYTAELLDILNEYRLPILMAEPV